MMLANTRRAQFFVLAAFVAWIVATQGEMLRYNASTNQLYMRCPAEPITDGDVLFIAIRRQHDDLALANWTRSDTGLVMYERMRLQQPPTPPYLLEVVLDYVTCYDVTSYICSMIVSPHNGPVERKNQSQPFTFEGEVADPVLRVHPIRARHNVGDVIRLTCTARIGTPSNSIIWETSLPGDNFTPVTGHCEKRTNITEHNPTDPKSISCGVTSVSSVTHILTSDDDSRTWRCRLNNTNHHAVFVVAVQCPDGAGCSKPCRPYEQSTERAQGLTTQMVSSQVQASAIEVNEPTGMSKDSPDTLLILIAVICGLFVTMVISIVVMTTMLRKQTKKQLAPLMISPPPSDAPYPFLPISTDQSRSLPRIPATVDHYALHEDDLNLHNHEHHDTPRKMFSPATSSVYIPMSAIPSLHEEEGVMREGEGEENGMHDKRTESIYSNREAIEREATKACNGSAGSHDSHVTMGNLKGWI